MKKKQTELISPPTAHKGEAKEWIAILKTFGWGGRFFVLIN